MEICIRSRTFSKYSAGQAVFLPPSTRFEDWTLLLSSHPLRIQRDSFLHDYMTHSSISIDQNANETFPCTLLPLFLPTMHGSILPHEVAIHLLFFQSCAMHSELMVHSTLHQRNQSHNWVTILQNISIQCRRCRSQVSNHLAF